MMNLRSAIFAISFAATWGVAVDPLRAQAQPALQQAQTAPDVAQQVQVPPPPQRQSVTEDMLLRENDRIVGRVSIPDARLSYL